MHRFENPSALHPPLGVYSHTATVPAGAEWLCVAGQVGADAAGEAAEGFAAQAERAFSNVVACLEAGGYRRDDLVKLTTYIVDGPDRAERIAAMRAARIAVFGEDVRPTATLVIVAGLAAPQFLIEVEGWAARP